MGLRVRGELLKVFYNDQPASLIAALIYSTAIAWALADGLQSPGPWVWLGGIVATICARTVLTIAFRRQQHALRNHARWETLFFIGALVMGLHWGAMAWIFYPQVPVDYRVFIIVVIGGVTAASSRSIASHILAFYAFALATILPLSVRLLLAGSTPETFMGAFTLLFMLFMMSVARSFRNTFANSFRLSVENADLAVKLTQDIAARQAAEEALRASEERLRFTQYALDHAQDLVAIVDRAGHMLHISEAFCRFTGRAENDVRTTKAWESFVALNDVRFPAWWDEVKRRGRLTFESDVRAAAGEPKPVEVNASYLAFKGREAVCMIARDLTDRRAAELEKLRLQQQLQETQKLESLGVLAGGIAHDFNNLLTAILGNATLARDALARREDVREMLGQIEHASNQAAGLCRQMLAYAGKGRFLVEQIDLSALVADSAKLLEMTVAHRARLDLRLDPSLPTVLADPSQMRQIVLNLVHNAAEAAVGGNGHIVVATSQVRIDRALIATARVAADLDGKRGVCLEVTDNGCGMDRTTLERIFEPFFTTKFTGRGLGLAAVIGIVRSHQGLLHVHSEPGHGTTFRLVLAATSAPRQTAPVPTATPPAPAAKQGCVLVVDDERAVRQVAKQTLERMGFLVEAAEGGQQALDSLAPDPNRFRLILLDITMPKMDGVQTLQEMRRRNVTTRVVLMSGFSEQQTRERAGISDYSAFLQKPFDVDSLRAIVESALASQAHEKTDA